jgi:hypothetical protein
MAPSTGSHSALSAEGTNLSAQSLTPDDGYSSLSVMPDLTLLYLLLGGTALMLIGAFVWSLVN